MARGSQYGIHHSQNYLTNASLVRRLVETAGIGSSDTVLEIGPGKGMITRELARAAGHVIAIEQDRRLAHDLASNSNLPGNVTVLLGDALQAQLPQTPYCVFANIPFRHTAAIVGKLTTGTAPPVTSWLIVQKEAAERYMLASTNTMQAIVLAVGFEISVEHQFSPSDFSPKPGVESVLMRIQRRQQPLIAWRYQAQFRSLVEVLFSAWQPTVKQSVKARLPRIAADRVVRASGIGWNQKVSTIPLTQWIRLFEEVLALNDDRVWLELSRWHQKLQEQRETLQKPTRTTTRRKQRSR